MSLPKQLIDSFLSIIKSPLITNGDLSKESLYDFVEHLNNAIPKQNDIANYAVYRFNRIKYLSNPELFIKDVWACKEEYHPLILWTNYNHILKLFKLTDKVFLGWDKARNRYRAFPMRKKETKPETIVDPKPEEKKELTTQDAIEADSESLSRGMDIVVARQEAAFRKYQEDQKRMQQITN